jgi:sugar phosphate isomerase/epimerase
MKLAYVYGTEETVAPMLGFQGEAQTIFPFLKENGYAAVEPFLRDPSLININAFETMVNRYGMEVACVGTGPVVSDDKLTFTNDKSDIRLAAVQRTKDIIDFASLFGSPVNIGKLRGDVDESQPEQSWKWMKECFLDVCEHADKQGINILLEPQNKNNINTINTTKEALAFLEEMNISNLLLNLDVYHMSFEDESILAGFIAAKHKLLHIHFADSNRGAPGQGELDFVTIMQTLKSIQYDHYISIEVSSEKDRHEEARRAAVYLSSITKLS